MISNKTIARKMFLKGIKTISACGEATIFSTKAGEMGWIAKIGRKYYGCYISQETSLGLKNPLLVLEQNIRQSIPLIKAKL